VTTNEAYELWSRIARGDKAADLDEWVQQVAKSLVADVFPIGAFPIGSERAPAALKAVGYVGGFQRWATVERFADEHPELTAAQIAGVIDLVEPIEPVISNPQKIAARVRSRRKKS
jgi:hypothetical protein